jgi:hypothetical protein
VEIGINDQEVEDQRRKKRKSPLTPMLLFRSLLSRMLLSPQLRSPKARNGRSPLARICSRVVNDIDLNLEPVEYAPDNAQNVSAFGNDPHDHRDVENGSDTNTGTVLEPQDNARRRATMPDEKRRAIFESLLAKAKNGNLKDMKQVKFQRNSQYLFEQSSASGKREKPASMKAC